MITCDKATKTSNSLICCNAMFHMLHDFVVILYLSHYYHVAMLQDMGNSCFIDDEYRPDLPRGSR